MNAELLIIGITIFFIFNTYSDGKCIKLVKSWKKYYQMAGIGFVGLSAFIFMKKYPSDSKSLLSHANGIIKYMPIDKESSDLLTPLMGMYNGTFSNNTQNYNAQNYNGNRMMQHQEQKILNSGRGGAGAGKNVKRSVSETKKKYVAAQQGWNCGACKKQLPAWFEVDHKIRLDNGGSNNVDNLIALCRDCHGKKTAFENL